MTLGNVRRVPAARPGTTRTDRAAEPGVYRRFEYDEGIRQRGLRAVGRGDRRWAATDGHRVAGAGANLFPLVLASVGRQASLRSGRHHSIVSRMRSSVRRPILLIVRLLST